MPAAKKVLFTSHTANFHKFNRPFMRMLKEQGYEVHYASAGEEKVYDTDKHFDIPFERSPFKLGNIKAYFKLKKIIDREKYDLIHTHTPMGSVVTRLAARKARKKGTRVIYTAHGFHFFKGAPLLNWIIYYPIEKYMTRHTDTLITINNEDFERAKKKFKTDVKYVPGVGVDLKRFERRRNPEARNQMRISLGVKEDCFLLVYMAELNKNKNQTMLIDTMEQLVKFDKNIQLLLVGKDSLRGFHSRLIKKKGLDKNIQLLGYRNDVSEILNAADLSVSASYREGLPVHIMEAMAAGVPVISTPSRGVKELIEVGKTGYLVDFKDNKVLAKSILKLSKDRETLHALGVCSAHRSKRYSVEIIKEKMKNIYGLKATGGLVRILHIVTIMNRAGLETMLMNYYRNIDRSKLQFDFLVHRNTKGDYDDEITALGGKIYYIQPMTLKDTPGYINRLSNFFKVHPEYNIVDSHLDALSAMPLAAAKKAGVVTRIAHSHTNSFDNDIKRPIRMIMKRFIRFYATDYMGCSLDALIFMFGSVGRTGTVMKNAIDLSEFKFSKGTRRSMRKSLSIRNSTLTIVHVGRFNYPKNHSFLVDVFHELKESVPDATLILVGGGAGVSSIKKKVNELGLQNDIKFLGLRPDVSNILQAADVFVMPSIYEGIPVVSIEAQATGLPCVFSSAVSNEVNLFGLSSFIDLDSRLSAWASEIVRLTELTRKTRVDEVRAAGYDINLQAKKYEAQILGIDRGYRALQFIG